MHLKRFFLLFGVLMSLSLGLVAQVPQEIGIHKIKHIIIIMQENWSFDSYFGTFPGAEGIPMKNGSPSVCSTTPDGKNCIKPYHDAADINYGGPHTQKDAIKNINGGKMDGFLQTQSEGKKRACKNPNDPSCKFTDAPDVMGYHDDHEIFSQTSQASDLCVDRAYILTS